jgi:hypothetical protein
MTAAPDLLAAIVAGTRRITEVRRAREPLAPLERRAAQATPRGDRFEAALSTTGRVNVATRSGPACAAGRSPGRWPAPRPR